jgi:RHS repeat-associated protein
MRINLFKTILVLILCYLSHTGYTQCSCSVLSPNAITATISGYNCLFKGSSVYLTASRPLGDSTLWYGIFGTDTLKIGSGTKIYLTPDSTRKYLARNVQTCYCAGPTQSTVYSSYVSLTIQLDTTASYIGRTILLVNNDPVLCSGASADVSIFAVNNTSSVDLIRDNTTNVVGGVASWGGFTLPYKIPLTNNTSSPQVVNLTFAPHIGTCMGTPQMTQVTVLPSLPSSNSRCYEPPAPAEYGGAFTARPYRGGILEFWAAPISSAIDGREWYKVVGQDTTFLGTGDTLKVVADTIAKYIARNKNNCTCSDSTHSVYYSPYTLMGSVTALQDTGSKPSFTLYVAPTMCSGSPTDIYAASNAYDPIFTYYRDDTTNVSGPVTGTVYQSHLMGIILKNKTAVPQRVRFLLRCGSRLASYWADDHIVYITVLPDSAASTDRCYFPATPNPWPFGRYTDVVTYTKGARIQYSIDTTIVASTGEWYKVVGNDTTYAGSGYTINITTDTSCQYIVRNKNVCACNSNAYYSPYVLVGAYSVSNAKLVNWTANNYMTTIASGTAFDIVPRIDTNVNLGFSLTRDNALVSGPLNAYGVYTYFSHPQLGATLTNTTNVPQLVKYYIRANANGLYYGTITAYITVLPSLVTARNGSRCNVPQQHTPNWQGLYISKGATVNVDLNGTGYLGGYGAVRNAADSVDFIDWYKTRGRGDTVFVGTTSVNLLGSISPISPPVNIVADTNFTLFTISRNVCYWSDSSVHTYKGGISVIANIAPLAQPLYTLSLTNNKPYIKSGTATNMAISSNGDRYYWYRSNQDKVSGVNGYGSASGIRSGSIIDTLTNLTNVPQLVYFAAYAHNNSCGSHVITSVIVYPSSNTWLTSKPINIRASSDTIITGTSDTLSADSLGGAVIQWFKGTCGSRGSNYLGTGNSIVVTVDSTTTYYARYRDYCTLNDTTAVDTINAVCSFKTIRTKDLIGKELLTIGYDPQWDTVHTGITNNRIRFDQNGTITFAVVAKDTPISAGFYYFPGDSSDYDSLSYSNSRRYNVGWEGGTYYVLNHGVKKSIPASIATVKTGDIIQVDKVEQDLYYRVNDVLIYHGTLSAYDHGYLAMSYWDLINRGPAAIIKASGLLYPFKGSYPGIKKDAPIDASQCIGDQFKNWIYSVVYDEDGNAISEGKVFYDELGRQIQAQSLNHTEHKVLATQTIYDAFGRPVVQTLPAPTGNSTLCYQDHFVAYGDDDYSYQNFEGVGARTIPGTTLVVARNLEQFPDPVTASVANSVGNYYSSNNTIEPYTPTTSYPYARTDYYPDLRGMVRQAGTPGDQKRMGMHTAKQMTFPVKETMSRYLAFRNVYVPTAVDGSTDNGLFAHAVMSVSIDQNGKRAASYTDQDGHAIATANIGTETTYSGNPGPFHTSFNIQSDYYTYNSMQPTGAKKYIEAFIQYSNQNISANNSNTVYVYDMLTDQLVLTLAANTSYTSLNIPSGFYRFESDDNFYIGQLFYDFKEFSYNIYDDGGRMVAQVAPNGSTQSITSAQVLYTNTQTYNTLGWLMSKTSTDETGPTSYLYGADGRIRFSQNPRQNNTGGKFSYTNYDNAGRPVEVGEYDPNLHISGTTPIYKYPGSSISGTDISTTSILFNNAGLTETGPSNKTYRRYFAYDVAQSDYPSIAGKQSFTLGQAVKMWDDNSNAAENTSWYSYDENGRTVTEAQSSANLGVRRMSYVYGMNGNVLNKNYPGEGMYYSYTYDADQRLQKVFTSHAANGGLETQASYSYYLHGPLKRKEIGGLTQGIDYTYTIEGWLKTINHPDRTPSADPGADGFALGSQNHGSFGRDVFGMALDYYDGDYVAANSNTGINGWLHDNTVPDLYNGSIKNQRWNSATPAGYDFPFLSSAVGLSPSHYLHSYAYDSKYQLTDATLGHSGTFFIPGSTGRQQNNIGDDYKEHFEYDANGNITTLLRNAYVDYYGTGGLDMDNLTYHYATNNNKLAYVQDQVPGHLYNDISSQSPGNYTYDATGRMEQSVGDNQYVEYDPYGKVTTVYNDALRSLKTVTYDYNERGYRSRKTLYTGSTIATNTASYRTNYITDASGQVLSIYEENVAQPTTPVVKQTEIPIYAGGRIGVMHPALLGSSDQSGGVHTVYTTSYELNDHLGNVRATISKGLTQGQYTVENATAYYATGMLMPRMQLYGTGANTYRYGYQGQYAEKDGETGWNDFELRDYDSRIGRWMMRDPAEQYWSPYMAMGNDWVNCTDPDGAWGEGDASYQADVLNNRTRAGAVSFGEEFTDGNGSTYRFTDLGWVDVKSLGGNESMFAGTTDHSDMWRADPLFRASWGNDENAYTLARYGVPLGSSGGSDGYDPTLDIVSLGSLTIGKIGANTVSRFLAREATERAFWNGAGSEAKALNAGFQTLGKTRAGRNLINLTSDMVYKPGSQAFKFWGRLSAAYAKGASGTVHVFQNAATGVGTESIWRLYEYPVLMANPKVTNIIYHY